MSKNIIRMKKWKRKAISTISKERTGAGLIDQLNERWINIWGRNLWKVGRTKLPASFQRLKRRSCKLAHGHRLSGYGSGNGGHAAPACVSTSSCPDEVKARSHNATASSFRYFFLFLFLSFSTFSIFPLVSLSGFAGFKKSAATPSLD